jgi:hypothetical protein
MRKGITPHLSEDDYRFLLNVLHPDRAPDREKLAKAFIIVRGFEPYMRVARRNTTS